MEIPEIEIRYRSGKKEKKKVTSSQDAYEALKEFFNRDTIEILEEFLVLYFDNNNQTLGWFRVSQGGISSSVGRTVMPSI